MKCENVGPSGRMLWCEISQVSGGGEGRNNLPMNYHWEEEVILMSTT